nr:hypothetical protein [bacterium]
MNEIRLSLAPSGALTLRLPPEPTHSRALDRAFLRLAEAEPRRKRRTRSMEGPMYPDHHNYFASPAQGTMLNAGQFG